MQEFDFECLRDQTINLLEELKNSKNQETLKEKISALWKNIPISNIEKEDSITLYKWDYNYSKEATIYMIIYHLYNIGCDNIVETFYNEYSGDHKKYLNICINNYKEFVYYTNKFKENDFMLKNFINQIGVSEELIFAYNILRFLESKNLKQSIKELQQTLSPIITNFSEELKEYLKCLVLPQYTNILKKDVKLKIQHLFIKDFCNLRDFVNGDFLPIVFEQGCIGFNFLSKHEHAFKNFEDIILPVEIPLGKKKQYHSLFVCPVIKEVCSEENKPVLLECNHVISSSAANILSKYGAVDVFKCPYCPEMSGYEKILKLELYK